MQTSRVNVIAAYLPGPHLLGWMTVQKPLPAIEIGRKLRLRRRIRGMSLREAAAAAEVSLGQLSQIERGVSTPSIAGLQRICQALQMPIAWLFDDKAAPANEGEVVVRA